MKKEKKEIFSILSLILAAVDCNLMSRTIERTPFMWEKGWGDKCCPGPESCLPCARPVLGASVSEWHIRP